MRPLLRAVGMVVGSSVVYLACASSGGSYEFDDRNTEPVGASRSQGGGGSTSDHHGGSAGRTVSADVKPLPVVANPTPVAKADESTPGSRLRPRVLVTKTADGATMRQSAAWFAPWWDSVLDTPCAFVNTKSDGMRCVPESSSSGQLFADPACMVPAIEAGCGLASKYMTVSAPSGAAADGCGGTSQVVARLYTTKPLNKGSTLYLLLDPKCSEYHPAGDYASIDKEIPLGSLVGGTVTEEH